MTPMQATEAFTCLLGARVVPHDAMLVRHFSLGILLSTFVTPASSAVGLWAGVWYTVGWSAWGRDLTYEQASAAHVMAAVAFACGGACASAFGSLAARPGQPRSVAFAPSKVDAASRPQPHESTVLVFSLGLFAVTSLLGLNSDGCAGLPVEADTWGGAAAAVAAVVAALALLASWWWAPPLSRANIPPAVALALGLTVHAGVPLARTPWVWPFASSAYWAVAWVISGAPSAEAGGWLPRRHAGALSAGQLVTAAVLSIVDVYGGARGVGEPDAKDNFGAVLLACTSLAVAAAAVSLVATKLRGRTAASPANAKTRGWRRGPQRSSVRLSGGAPGHLFMLLVVGCVAVAGAPGRLPDLVPDALVLRESLRVQHGYSTTDACVVSEGCLAAGLLGTPRTLLRYSTRVWNVGAGDLVVGPPPPLHHKASPTRVHPHGPNGTWWDWHECHGHWHLAGFARARLMQDYTGGSPVARAQSLKVSFCLRDDKCANAAAAESAVLRHGVGWSGKRRYDCESHGISAGCSDVYDMHLDCQWIDVTDVPPGRYVLEVTVNPDGLFEEESLENNVAKVPVDLRPRAPGRPAGYATRWLESVGLGLSVLVTGGAFVAGIVAGAPPRPVKLGG